MQYSQVNNRYTVNVFSVNQNERYNLYKEAIMCIYSSVGSSLMFL